MLIRIVGICAMLAAAGLAQPPASAISARLHTLRQVPDDRRGAVTKQLALEIRALPPAQQAGFAQELANLATEGDFGMDTLQEVATTLGESLRGSSSADDYRSLAALVRYEHVRAPEPSSALDAAMASLAAEDARREKADFTLSDLTGKRWNLRSLRGKVVLVNFWATWCPPCRKEMPDLNALYKEFAGKGLVVLAISDEDADKVKPFIEQDGFHYPVLLDPGGKVSEAFAVQGIPKTFIFNREGKLAAESIDMRTRGQFLKLLAQAGLE